MFEGWPDPGLNVFSVPLCLCGVSCPSNWLTTEAQRHRDIFSNAGARIALPLFRFS